MAELQMAELGNAGQPAPQLTMTVRWNRGWSSSWNWNWSWNC
jgi:hypothetical protein